MADAIVYKKIQRVPKQGDLSDVITKVTMTVTKSGTSMDIVFDLDAPDPDNFKAFDTVTKSDIRDFIGHQRFTQDLHSVSVTIDKLTQPKETEGFPWD